MIAYDMVTGHSAQIARLNLVTNWRLGHGDRPALVARLRLAPDVAGEMVTV